MERRRWGSAFLVAMFIGILSICAGRGFVFEEKGQNAEEVPFQETEFASDVDILSSTEFLGNTETLSDSEAKSTENWIDIEAEYRGYNRAEDEREEIIQEDKYFKVLYTGNYTYYYAVYNSEGAIVKEGEGRQPLINYIDDTVIQIGNSAGTSAMCMTYYDTVNDRLSEVYFNPLAAEYGKVAYLEWGEEVVLAVKDIFGEDGYYEEFSLELSPMVTPVECVKFLDENRLYISYHSGESMENRDVVLKLGNRS